MAHRVWIDPRPMPEPPKAPPGYDSVQAMAAIGRAAAPHLLDMQVGFIAELFAQGDAERIARHGGEWKNGALGKASAAVAMAGRINQYLFAKRIEVTGTVQTQSHEDRLAEMMRAIAAIPEGEAK